MDKIRKNKIETESLKLMRDLLPFFFEKGGDREVDYYPLKDNNKYRVKERDIDFLKAIMKASIDTVEFFYKEIDNRYPEEEKEVYCDDIVTLKIDNELYRYYLTYYDYDEEKEEVDLLNDTTQDFYNDEILDADEGLGRMLVGKHVGDEFTYSNDDKCVHTVKILDTRRTKLSIKINPVELDAEQEMNKRRGK